MEFEDSGFDEVSSLDASKSDGDSSDDQIDSSSNGIVLHNFSFPKEFSALAMVFLMLFFDFRPLIIAFANKVIDKKEETALLI